MPSTNVDGMIELGAFRLSDDHAEAFATVVALRQRFETVRRAELDRLTVGLPPDTRDRVDGITRLIVEKLLLTPTEQLKSIGDAETVNAYSDALTRLFGLNAAASGEDTGGAAAEAERGDHSSRRVQPFARPQKR